MKPAYARSMQWLCFGYTLAFWLLVLLVVSR